MVQRCCKIGACCRTPTVIMWCSLRFIRCFKNQWLQETTKPMGTHKGDDVWKPIRWKAPALDHAGDFGSTSDSADRALARVKTGRGGVGCMKKFIYIIYSNYNFPTISTCYLCYTSGVWPQLEGLCRRSRKMACRFRCQAPALLLRMRFHCAPSMFQGTWLEVQKRVLRWDSKTVQKPTEKSKILEQKTSP